MSYGGYSNGYGTGRDGGYGGGGRDAGYGGGRPNGHSNG